MEDFLMIIDQYNIQHCILSDVRGTLIHQLGAIKQRVDVFIELNHMVKVPVQVCYETPETLGKDRLAAVIGAFHEMQGKDLLVIDAGTAITYDFISAEGQYPGGNIAPGLEMRSRALHEFTGKLPYFLPDENTEDFPGRNTKNAIQSGVLYGLVHEIDGYVDKLMLKYPNLSVFLTGGSAEILENRLKYRIFARKNLVLNGLNQILKYNVK
jgi:type III pantothenate kinase